MPEMDGIEAAREIRRRNWAARDLPLIATTANALTRDREECLAAGMSDFLTKPIRLEELAEVIARWTAPVTAIAAHGV